MFKRLVMLILVIVMAKPAYDMVSDFLEDNQAVLVEEVSQQIDAVNVIVEDLAEPAIEATPGTVTSMEQLADTFQHYFGQLATDFTIQYKGSTADLENILNVAVDTALSRDTYIAGHLAVREIAYEYTKQTATIRVKQSYLTTPQQEQVVEAVIEQVVADINIKAMTDYEKVKFVNDYIVKQTVYSDEATASPHSAYAIAYEGRGVCQGYALFAQKLLTTLGVESLYVTGEVYTGGHAWNLVKLDGEWYHLDTTWNDPVPDRGTGVRYNYFLLNDTDMQVDHTWQSGDYPQATSTKYRYMHSMQDMYVKDGYAYFSNIEDENKLYRLNEATGISERLGDVRALYIVGTGDWLYFSNYSNGAYLSRMKNDGSALEVIYRDEVQSLFIEESHIYFTTDEGKKKLAL